MTGMIEHIRPILDLPFFYELYHSDEVKPNIREDVLRIHCTHLILECTRGMADAAKGRI